MHTFDFPVFLSFFKSQYSIPGNLRNNLASSSSLTPCRINHSVLIQTSLALWQIDLHHNPHVIIMRMIISLTRLEDMTKYPILDHCVNAAFHRHPGGISRDLPFWDCTRLQHLMSSLLTKTTWIGEIVHRPVIQSTINLASNAIKTVFSWASSIQTTLGGNSPGFVFYLCQDLHKALYGSLHSFSPCWDVYGTCH